MAATGSIRCDNCNTSLHLTWVNVKKVYRGHHVSPDCPLCGDGTSFQKWLDAGQANGQTVLLVNIEHTAR